MFLHRALVSVKKMTNSGIYAGGLSVTEKTGL